MIENKLNNKTEESFYTTDNPESHCHFNKSFFLNFHPLRNRQNNYFNFIYWITFTCLSTKRNGAFTTRGMQNS